MMHFRCWLILFDILTVVSSVGATDDRGVLAGLASSSHVVRASANGSGGGKPGEGLEVKPQLADVIGHLVEGEGAGASCGGGVGAGVVGVPDVGGVGGEGASTGGGVDNT